MTLNLNAKEKEMYEKSLNETPYTPYFEVPFKLDMKGLGKYLRQKQCSSSDLTDEEKARFIDGGLETLKEFRNWMKDNNHPTDY